MGHLPPYSDKVAWKRLHDSGRTDRDIADEVGVSRQAVQKGMTRSGARVPDSVGNNNEYIPWPVANRDLYKPLMRLLRELSRFHRGEPVENAKEVQEFAEFLEHARWPNGVYAGPVVVAYDRVLGRFFFEPATAEELNPRVFARAHAHA